MAAMAWLLGVDGGGTRTRLAVTRASDHRTCRVETAGTSLARFSAGEVAVRLTDGLRRLLDQEHIDPPEVIAACAGFASAGAAEHRQCYENLLRQFLPRARVEVTTDAEIAWQGATGGEDGIVLIAGTGSIAWGRRGMCWARAGGEGPPHDAGSGDWLGREAVREELVGAPADGNFSELMPRLAGAGDVRARQLWERGGQELANLALRCAEQLDWRGGLEATVYPMGGVFEHLPAIGAALAQAWPGRIEKARSTAVDGALTRARRLVEHDAAST